MQTAWWLHRPFALLDRCAAEFGPLFTLRISGWGTLVVVSDPGLARTVLRGDGATLKTGRANELMTLLVGESSVFVIDDDDHRRIRRRLVAAANTAEAQDLSAIRESAERHLARAAGPKAVNIQDEMGGITLEVIARMVIGLGPGPTLDRMSEALRTLLGTTGSAVAFVRPLQRTAFPGNPANRLRRVIAVVDEVISDEIQVRRVRSGPDILSALVAADEESVLSDREIRDQVISLIAAANDTTASALAWCLSWIHHTPGVLDRLLAELAGTEPDDPAILDLPYLDAVVNESLRLTPVVELMSRSVTGPTCIDGYDLPDGTLLSACSYLSHRNPDVFDRPATFDPDRFIGRRYSGDEFYPFGGGIRRCLGAALAIREIKVVLGAALRSHTFSPSGPMPRAARRNVTITPSSGARMAIGWRHR